MKKLFNGKSLLPEFIWKYLRTLEKKTVEELEKIWAIITDYEKLMMALFYLIGTLLTPITLFWVLRGYERSYKRLWEDKNIPPVLHPLPKSFKISMLITGLVPITIFTSIVVLIFVISTLGYSLSSLFDGVPSERHQTQLRDAYNDIRIKKDSLYNLSIDPNYYKYTHGVRVYNPATHSYEQTTFVAKNPADPNKSYYLSSAQKDSFNRITSIQKRDNKIDFDKVQALMDSFTKANEAYPMVFWDSDRFLKRHKHVNGKYELDVDAPSTEAMKKGFKEAINEHKHEVIVGGSILGAIIGLWMIWAYLTTNFAGSALVIVRFNYWRSNLQNLITERGRHGTARFAYNDELNDYHKKGFYIGGDLTYSKQGHMLTVSGTRGGKFVNLISQNLLGMGGYDGSWVVIDPKGEIAAVTARYQRESGKNVVILNPWATLGMPQHGYNPLDLLLDTNNPNLIDDAKMIAEMVVPMKNGDKDGYWSDRARGIISILITHLCTFEAYKDKRTLTTIWQWLRNTKEDWEELTKEMTKNEHALFGHAIQTAGLELDSFLAGNEKEAQSVLSTAQRWTDFLNSPAMTKAVAKSDFDPKELSKGNTIIYVVIPAERIPTHSQWLRLVSTSLMRFVIREPNKRVTFLLDEFFALGYMSEIEVALGAYAGYNLSLWLILQNLTQLEKFYDKNWENFIGSCAVRHFFNMSDKFSSQYVSDLMGKKSVAEYNKGFRGFFAAFQGIEITNVTARELVTADEFRRSSDQTIYMMIDQRAVTTVTKKPYWEMPELEGRYDPNPYYKEDN